MKTAKRRYPRLQTRCSEPSLTKTSFQEECNINSIMKRFQKTGAITHYAKHAPSYGECTSIDLLDAQLIIANANTMFEELPSSIRKKFDNDPALFLDFVQDEKNQEEMVKLGLKKAPLVKPGDTDTTQSDPVSTSPKPDKAEPKKDDGPDAKSTQKE